MRLLLIAATVAVVYSSPLPDHPSPSFGGFQPVHGARGPPVGSAGGSYSPPPPPPGPGYAAPGPAGGPTKTIFVNVPHPEPHPPPKPIAAGPPRKHYKIVFIRAPAPPPPPQPILPPRTEQKTLIYVLHQRPQQQEQQVIEVPNVKHNPEVFFVQYDNPPSAEELQQLSAGNLNGFSVNAQPLGAGGYAQPLGTGGSGFDIRLSDSDDVVLPIGGSSSGGGLPPVPSIDNFGVDLPLSSGGASFGGSGDPFGAPLPLDTGAGAAPLGGGSIGAPLPGLGASGVPGSSFGNAGGVGAPLPIFGGARDTGFPAGSGAGIGPGGAGPGLRLIGDEVVRPIGNTGFFQEVDDDIAALSGLAGIDSLEFDDAFAKRSVAAARTKAKRS